MTRPYDFLLEPPCLGSGRPAAPSCDDSSRSRRRSSSASFFFFASLYRHPPPGGSTPSTIEPVPIEPVLVPSLDITDAASEACRLSPSPVGLDNGCPSRLSLAEDAALEERPSDPCTPTTSEIAASESLCEAPKLRLKCNPVVGSASPRGSNRGAPLIPSVPRFCNAASSASPAASATLAMRASRFLAFSSRLRVPPRRRFLRLRGVCCDCTEPSSPAWSPSPSPSPSSTSTPSSTPSPSLEGAVSVSACDASPVLAGMRLSMVAAAPGQAVSSVLYSVPYLGVLRPAD